MNKIKDHEGKEITKGARVDWNDDMGFLHSGVVVGFRAGYLVKVKLDEGGCVTRCGISFYVRAGKEVA